MGCAIRELSYCKRPHCECDELFFGFKLDPFSSDPDGCEDEGHEQQSPCLFRQMTIRPLRDRKWEKTLKV